ncbi:hypothetical protein E2320_005292 [Naja naja]|nr:hypothetical protein E2320_005292 [Naja naja]
MYSAEIKFTDAIRLAFFKCATGIFFCLYESIQKMIFQALYPLNWLRKERNGNEQPPLPLNAGREELQLSCAVRPSTHLSVQWWQWEEESSLLPGYGPGGYHTCVHKYVRA